jgi:prepilin-type N-terminal cleavage/methylation domain-containing protein
MKSVSPRGYSLLEILIATSIFALAIVPIYRALSAQSALEIESAKLSLAKSILTSVKEEILSRPFDTILGMVSGGKLTGQSYPFALAKLLEAQKKHRDFELEILAVPKMDSKALELKAVVTYTGLNGAAKSEELIFLHVLQEY